MSILILNTTILPMNNKMLHQGAVAIEDQKILDVGKTNELKRKYGKGYEKNRCHRQSGYPRPCQHTSACCHESIKRICRRLTASRMAGRINDGKQKTGDTQL